MNNSRYKKVPRDQYIKELTELNELEYEQFQTGLSVLMDSHKSIQEIANPTRGGRILLIQQSHSFLVRLMALPSTLLAILTNQNKIW